jgi:hypothetical protein
VINERQLHRHRTRAGLRIGDARHAPRPEPEGDPYERLKERARARNIALAIAGRDLADAPIYIVCQPTLAAEFGRAEWCEGYTAPSLDLYLADHILAYRGRGPCMVVNDLNMLADKTDEEFFELFFLSHVLHELAHILARPQLYEERTGEDPFRIKWEALVMGSQTAKPEPTRTPPYLNREAPFIRDVLHPRYRAAKAGVKLAPGPLFNPRLYGLSPPAKYQKALAGEPKRCAGMLFRDILASEPPPAFTEL